MKLTQEGGFGLDKAGGGLTGLGIVAAILAGNMLFDMWRDDAAKASPPVLGMTPTFVAGAKRGEGLLARFKAKPTGTA